MDGCAWVCIGVWCEGVCVCVWGGEWMDGFYEWMGVWREVNSWVCMSVGCDCVGV